LLIASLIVAQVGRADFLGTAVQQQVRLAGAGDVVHGALPAGHQPRIVVDAFNAIHTTFHTARNQLHAAVAGYLMQAADSDEHQLAQAVQHTNHRRQSLG
jgi:hypothetical protein